MLKAAYSSIVLRRPGVALAVAAALLALAALVLPGFRVDEDADSLTLETDPGRLAYERVREIFGSDDYVVVAVAPEDPASDESVRLLERLSDGLEGLGSLMLPDGTVVPGVSRVLSPSRQRLFRSVPGIPAPLAALREFTLSSPEVDRVLALEELRDNELVRGSLVSADGTTFAVIAYLAADSPAERDEDAGGAGHSEHPASLAGFVRPSDERERRRERIRTVVRAIRERVVDAEPGLAEVRASGLPTIVVDMVDALRRDLLTLGALAALFMVIVLAVALRTPRWVLLPALTVALVIAVVLSGMVLAGKSSTVVTANLSALLVIVAIAHAIHIAVRFREVTASHPGLDSRQSAVRTALGIGRPCLYAALTTAVGFASIAVSDIRPNVDFGVAMALGALFAWLASFWVIPPALALLPREGAGARRQGWDTDALERTAGWVVRHARPIAGVAAAFALVAGAGVLQLDAETRFTDYFRSSSPVSRGLEFIDGRLGGTTPLEVVLRAQREGAFLDEEQFDAIASVHEWLAARPEIGAVTSIASLRREAAKILAPLGGPAPTPRQLVQLAEGTLGRAALRGLLEEFVTEDFATARVLARVRESEPGLDRQRLLEELRSHLASRPEIARLEPEVTGMFVLYTNMLSSLVGSLVRSSGTVTAALLLMMTLLFRSLRVALVSFVPNLLPVLIVLGAMGWIGIPLDMMTMMIASVTLGISIDATIHYTVRYRRERERGGTIDDALLRAHGGTGRAIFYTAATVVGGMWVLCFSEFLPTVWFGLMTSAAMVVSIAASLVLLPALLSMFVKDG
jgi:predicted RND superfamily exporter protein